MAIQLTQRDTEQSIGCCDSRRQDTGDEDGPAFSTYSAGKAALCPLVAQLHSGGSLEPMSCMRELYQ
jgi:hypothetical protein